MVQTQISSTPAIGTVKNRLQFKVPSEKKVIYGAYYTVLNVSLGTAVLMFV